MLYLYEHMGKPLKRLPQPPLKGPRGERLVLRSSSHCFCNKRQQYSFYNKNIASQDAMGFLRDINGQMVDFPNYSEYRWKWPAVVLMPEEYKLRVGGIVRKLYSTTLFHHKLFQESCLCFLLHHVFPFYVITQWGSAHLRHYLLRQCFISCFFTILWPGSYPQT